MTDDTTESDDEEAADTDLQNRVRANAEFAQSLRSTLAANLGQTGFNSDDGARNHYDVFGWPRDVLDGWDEENWLALYLRNAYARIAIEKPAFTTWRDAPEIVDPNTDAGETSEFERTVNKVAKNHDLWSYCERTDRAAGIGQHGLLLIGLSDVVGDDGPRGNLSEWETDARKKDLDSPSDITQLKPVLGAQIEDIDYGDADSERWDMPVEYTIDLGEDIDSETEDDSEGTIRCHWTRVIDVPATRPLDDETLARPRIEPILNNILDIEKILGAAAEAGYRAADYGLHLNADPTEVDMSGGMDDLADELQAYEQDLQRYIRTAGVDVERLGGDIQDPSGIVENNLDAIAGQTGIPKKEFRGNESGEVSGAEADERSYLGGIAERREQYATPYIARPVIKRLMDIGIVPPPKAGEFEARWPDLVQLSAQDAAEIESQRAQVIQAVPGLAGDMAIRYLKNGAEALPDPDDGGAVAANLDVDEADEAVQETFETTVNVEIEPGQRANADPPLDEPVDLPASVVSAAEAAAENEDTIPDDCGTGRGTQRRDQIRSGDVTVRDLLTRDNGTPIPAYGSSHAGDFSEGAAETPVSEWTEEMWQQCGNAGLARWGFQSRRDIELVKEKANELAQQRGEAAPYDDVSANATRYGEGDEVTTPQGVGVVADVLTETVDAEDETIEASDSSPTYVVVVEDGRVGYETYKATDLHSTTIETGVDDPAGEMGGDGETANALGRVLSALAPSANADFSPPPSWRKSSTPNRVIALKAFAGMNGSFDGCVREMRGSVSTPKDFCGSFLDYVIGNPYWRGDSILPGD